jgi:hypothetical protein
VWSTNHRRYYSSAEQTLQELVPLADEVVKRWPANSGTILRKDQQPPGLHELCRRRDRVSDSVKLFAAIAVEGFINYYGVVRLGQKQFDRHFERLPMIKKVELLLLICDGLALTSDDSLVTALKGLAEMRNQLAHPKAREVTEDAISNPKAMGRIPEDATEAVRLMKGFFRRFAELVPDSQTLLP